MKKIFTLIVASAGTLLLNAQPTFDFENWTGTGVCIEPSNWESANVLACLVPSDPQQVFQATSPDVHGGTYAMKITTVNLSFNPSPSLIPNPYGVAFTGTVSASYVPILGTPNTSRWATVSFWYKYSPVSAGDTASCFIVLTKWNTSTKVRDTIADGFWMTNLAASSYTQNTSTLLYKPSTMYPDTMTILFSATTTRCLSCGKVGSILWVDDIVPAGWNAVNETEYSKGVSVFPNPANDFTTITAENVSDAYSVEISDMTGKIISSSILNQSQNAANKKSAVINMQGIANGLYAYRIIDKNKTLLRSGKISVVR